LKPFGKLKQIAFRPTNFRKIELLAV